MPYKDKQKLKEYLRGYHEKRMKFIQEAKSKPCADCKIEYPYYVMDFDHIRDKKEFTISYKKCNRSIESLRKEIEKCDVVCSNCHRIRTFERQNNSY